MRFCWPKPVCPKNAGILLLLLAGCAILAYVIPPLKSPDEHDHIERAYLLGKGVLVLDRPAGKSSGGDIDSGLLAYLDRYPYSQGKISEESMSAAGQIGWSGQRAYASSPGTGYYFPVIYLPQTSGLLIGEWLGLSVDHSYRLSRAFAILAAALILYFSFTLHPPNPLVLGLIALPMTLFQISSATLDGIATALAVFAISAFMRIARDGERSAGWLHYALAIVVAVLASSRVHALPMLILLAATFFYSKRRRALLSCAAATLFILGWTLFALKTTVDLRVPIGESSANIVAFYLHHPFQFLSVLWQTVSDSELQSFYYFSFLGILGWLDTPFGIHYYMWFGVIIAIVAALSVTLRGARDDWPQRLLLACVALISALFIFFALLVTWSPHPARVIAGVQGRYFLVPAVILAYAVGGNAGLFDGFRRKLASGVVLSLFVLSLAATVELVVERYYLTEAEKLALATPP